MTTRMMIAGAVLGLAGFAATAASAAVLTGNLTADNEFAAYISTTPGDLGTLVDYGSNWQQAYGLSVVLKPGQTYYLHVIADNFFGPGNLAGGNPDAFLASLTLTGDAVFSNGQKTLLSNTTNWTADANPVSEQLYGFSNPPAPPVSWTSPTDAPVGLAANGDVGTIWYNVNGSNPVPGFPADAELIWSSQNPDPTGESFFSTTITSVPEPASWAMLLLGLGGIGFMMRVARRSARRAVNQS